MTDDPEQVDVRRLHHIAQLRQLRLLRLVKRGAVEGELADLPLQQRRAGVLDLDRQRAKVALLMLDLKALEVEVVPEIGRVKRRRGL